MCNEEGKGRKCATLGGVNSLTSGRAEERQVCSRGAGEDGCTESVTLTTGRGTEGSVCSLLQPPLQPPHPQSVQALLTYDQ